MLTSWPWLLTSWPKNGKTSYKEPVYRPTNFNFLLSVLELRAGTWRWQTDRWTCGGIITRKHSIPISKPRRRLVTPPSEYRWIAVLVYKMNLLTLWPLKPKTVPLLGYLKVIPYTKFEHFGIIRFWIMLRTNRQTNIRTRKSYPRSSSVARPTTPVQYIAVWWLSWVSR